MLSEWSNFDLLEECTNLLLLSPGNISLLEMRTILLRGRPLRIRSCLGCEQDIYFICCGVIFLFIHSAR